MQILLVDDDVIALNLLSNAITCFGYDVLCANNGREALDLVRKHSPRMIISDVNMPELDGEELCREVRRKNSIHYTYIILLTSAKDTKSVVSGLDAGADDYLAKPIQPEELRLRIEAGKRILAIEGRDMMIFSLAKLAESRDNDTGRHLERIREFSKILAVELATHQKFESIIDQQFIDLIYMTSPLHDIGKVGIPDHILLKPGKLTDDEFEAMKLHTLIGGETLRAAAESHPEATFLQMALDITLMHHEKWNGKGYPHGLSGEDIPLSARIVAVADVYDALTTQRVYKPAFSHDEAREIILESCGSHFDPDIVEAFVKVEPEMRRVKELLDSHCSESNPSFSGISEMSIRTELPAYAS